MVEWILLIAFCQPLLTNNQPFSHAAIQQATTGNQPLRRDIIEVAQLVFVQDLIGDIL
jgi:hypothetical protein